MIARDGSSAPRMHQKSAESEARDQQASSSRAPHASRQRDHVEDLHEKEHISALLAAKRSKTLNVRRPRPLFLDWKGEEQQQGEVAQQEHTFGEYEAISFVLQ